MKTQDYMASSLPSQASAISKDRQQQRYNSKNEQNEAMENIPSTSERSNPRALRRGKFRRLGKFIYNKDDYTFCHRTCKSWLAVCGYYLIFVIIILLIFLALLWVCVIFLTRHQNRPWMPKKDLIEDNIPGISYMPNIDYLSDSVIWYKVTDSPEGRAKKYVKQIGEYFNKLEEMCKRNVHVNCNFNRSALGPCGENNFGYDTLSPCIIVRLNKLEDWLPKGYEEIPSGIPEHLKDQMKTTKEDRLWIDCLGLDEYDQDHIDKLAYYPMPGYPASAFPYTDANRQYYASPVVALHLTNIDKGRVLCLKCNLYASNYYQEAHFEQLTKTYVYVENLDE